jgi:hypothetical protein
MSWHPDAELTRTVSTTIRQDEIKVIDGLARQLKSPYTANRSSMIRLLVREALEARGVGIDPLNPPRWEDL